MVCFMTTGEEEMPTMNDPPRPVWVDPEPANAQTQAHLDKLARLDEIRGEVVRVQSLVSQFEAQLFDMATEAHAIAEELELEFAEVVMWSRKLLDVRGPFPGSPNGREEA
jgi:hypothetical protein